MGVRCVAEVVLPPPIVTEVNGWSSKKNMCRVG